MIWTILTLLVQSFFFMVGGAMAYWFSARCIANLKKRYFRDYDPSESERLRKTLAEMKQEGKP